MGRIKQTWLLLMVLLISISTVSAVSKDVYVNVTETRELRVDFVPIDEQSDTLNSSILEIASKGLGLLSGNFDYSFSIGSNVTL